jgi:glycerol-3-phosphate acyltransferase PlsY
MWWAFIVAAVIGYLLGSVPAGLIAGRVARGIDVRDYGSGKTGVTNVLRMLGPRISVLVGVADIAKGAIPVVIARVLIDDAYGQTVAGMAALVGHDWPLFAGFRGGRGVSTSFGALLAMSPLVALALVPVGIAIGAVTRYMSVMSIGGSIITAVTFVVLAVLGLQPWAYAVFAVAAAGLIVALHRENMGRLLAGREPKIGRGGVRRRTGEAPGSP